VGLSYLTGNTQIQCVGSPYLTGNTSCLRYRAQTVNAVCRNSRCLLWEPYGTHRYTVWAVRTSQETHHFSAAEPNRLMLCGETAAVCCENRTEHTDTLCGQSVLHRRHRYIVWAVRTSQETHNVSAAEPNRLTLWGETVAVCCENRADHTNTVCGQSVLHRRSRYTVLAVHTSQETTDILFGQNAGF
jgi:hypothetical protein